MSSSDRDEKELEKHDEKDEKAREKTSEEKSLEEKHRRDPLSAIVWAIILIWVGLVLLADTTGLLDRFASGVARNWPIFIPFLSEVAWTIIAAGIGVILVGEVIVRLLVPAYRGPVGGTAILAAVMFGLAFGNWSLIWPLVLVAIGASMLLGGIFRRGGKD